MTLEAALAEARANSPLLRVAQAAVLLPEAALAQAGRFSNPTLSSGLFPGLSSNTTTGFGVSVGKSFEVAGQRTLRRAVSRAQVGAARSLVDDTERRLRMAVGKSFYTVRVGEQTVQVLDSVVTVAERLLEATELKLKGGFVPELDRNLARVELLRAKLQRAQAIKEIVARKAELNALMGRSAQTEFSTSGPLVYGDLPSELDLERLLAQTREVRPDLRALGERARAASANASLARKLGFPDLFLGAGFTRDADRLRTFALSAGVSLPVFNRNQYGKDVARAEMERVAAETDVVSLTISQEVRGALARLEAARTRLTGYRDEILVLADSNQRFSSLAYARGELDISTTLLAQRQFAEAQVEYLNAVLGYDRAALELEGAVGMPLVETAEDRSGKENP